MSLLSHLSNPKKGLLFFFIKPFIAGKLDMTFKKTEVLQNDEGVAVRVNGKRAGGGRLSGC
jgi:hypothetical protein